MTESPGMSPGLGRRITALLTSKDESSVELVMSANGLAAIGLAALAWLQVGLSFAWVAALVPGVFFLLTTCLVFRYTVWIAAALGSVMIATSAACLLAGLMSHVRYGAWIGGGLGAAGGLAVAGWTYARIARIARAPFRSDCT